MCHRTTGPIAAHNGTKWLTNSKAHDTFLLAVQGNIYRQSIEIHSRDSIYRHFALQSHGVRIPSGQL